MTAQLATDPAPASRLLGYAGLLPFAAGAALALFGPPPWRGTALTALAAYGAPERIEAAVAWMRSIGLEVSEAVPDAPPAVPAAAREAA